MKRVMLISPLHTHPPYAGNSERILRLLLALQEIGCEISFLHIPVTKVFGKYDNLMMKKIWKNKLISLNYTYPRTSLITLFNRFIRHLARFLRLSYRPIFLIDELYDNSINQCLKEIAKQEKIDVVIVEYVFFSKALECFDNQTIKIIDTHDVFTDRHKLYQSNQISPVFFYTNLLNEKKGLDRADKIIAIQENERTFFEEKLGLKNKVYTIGHFLELDNIFDVNVENNILFFASANTINIKSLDFLLGKVLKIVKQQIPKVNLLIGGSICDVLQPNNNYQKLGKIEDKKLLYKQASIVVNPILFGTGLKIKNVESLGYGMPLVTTSVGAEGIEAKADLAFLVADNSEDFAQKIILALSDKQFRCYLSQSAFSFAKEINQKNLNTLRSLVEI